MKRIMALFISIVMLSGCVNTFVYASGTVEYKSYSDEYPNTIISTRKTADMDYVFSIGAEKFTLLDVFDDEKSAYLVIANQSYESREVNLTSFTSSDEGSLNYYLNHAGGTTYNTINQDLKDHIDFEHVWNLDPAPNASTPIAEGTVFTAGITIPSLSEMEAYGDKLGYSDLQSHFATRTVLNGINNSNPSKDKNIFVYQYSGTNKSDINDTSWKPYNRSKPSVPIRPIFYLNEDFFKTVKIDLATTGEKVKAELRKIGWDTLVEIYEADEIIDKLEMTPSGMYVKINNLSITVRSGEEIKNGETLVANFDYAEANQYGLESAEYTWERVFGDSKETVGTGKEYIVKEADTVDGKYKIQVKVKVTDTEGNETVKTSQPTNFIPAIVTKSYAPNYNIATHKNVENNDYKFEYDGKSFTLIDVFNNDVSTFFVVPNDDYGRVKMTSVYFEPEAEGNIAYTMNETFVKSGIDGNMLPEGIIEHIDFKHKWVCEGAPENPDNNVKSSYAFEAGVTLPSFTEVEKYKSIFATVDNFGGFSRTAADFKNSSKEEVCYINSFKWNSGGSAISANHWDLPSTNSVRPVFYLDRSFFTEEYIELDKVGKEALELLKKIYTVEDLLGQYDLTTLEANGFVHKYTESLTVTGLSGGVTGISGKIISNTACSTDAVLIFAVCDSEGRTLTSKATRLILGGKNSEQNINITAGTLDAGSYYAKIMIWDNLFSANAKNSIIVKQNLSP